MIKKLSYTGGKLLHKDERNAIMGIAFETCEPVRVHGKGGVNEIKCQLTMRERKKEVGKKKG